MNTFAFRLLAISLSILFLFTGCTSSDDLNTNPENTAMGRYIEKTVPLLEENMADILAFRRTSSNEMEMICYASANKGKDPMRLRNYVFHPADQTWTEKPFLWQGPEKEDIEVQAAAWDTQDGYYFACTDWSDSEQKPYLIHVTADGTATPVPYKLPDGPNFNSSTIISLQLAENGDILINFNYYFYRIDANTGVVKSKYIPPTGIMDSYIAMGDQVAFSENSKIVIQDVNGDVVNEIPCKSAGAVDSTTNHPNNTRVLSLGEDNSLYFADKNGIFRWTPGSAVLECLLQGSLSSLSSPALSYMYFTAIDDRFYLISSGDDTYQFFSYEFNADVATLPATQLKLYSLEENPTVCQAISIFQRTNPDVYISYEVGLSDSAITREDAIKNLATQILASKSPDIIVMDGLPASYLEKGIFIDISDIVSPLVTDGTLQKNIAESFLQKDGSMAAVPAKYIVPMMHGDTAGIDSIHSVSDLADYLEKTKGKYWWPVTQHYSRHIFKEFYPSVVSSFIAEDGSIKEQELRQYLTDVKRISDMIPAVTYDLSSAPDSQFLYQFGALDWITNGTGVNTGHLASITDSFAPWQAIEEAKDKKSGKVAPLLNQSVFTPKTIIGISADSKQTDIAKSFLSCILSDSVQSYEFLDGIPIHKSFYEKFVEPQPEDRGFSGYGTSAYNEFGEENYFGLLIKYPPVSYREETVQMLSSLENPVFYDETTYGMIEEAAMTYFTGTKSLEEAMSGLLEKVKIYLAQ